MLPIGMNDSNNLRFKFLSFKVLIMLFMQSICFFELIMYSLQLKKTGFNFDGAGNFFFYIFAIFVNFYLTFAASKFKIMMQTWSEYEEIFLNPPYSIHCKSKIFAKKIRIFAIFFIGFLIGKKII